MNATKLHKNNVLPLTFEGALYFAGIAFLNENSIVPMFIDTFTGSLELVGLAVSLKYVFSLLPRLLIGPYVSHIKNVPGFLMRIMLVLRPLPLLMIPILFFIREPYVIVGIFLVIYSLLFASNAVINVPWMDLFGRTILADKRGKIHGYQQILGGIGGLGAGYIIKTTLDNSSMEDPVRYSIIFGCSGIVLLASALTMIPVRDYKRRDKVKTHKIDVFNYLMELPKQLRLNLEFQKVMKVRVTYIIANGIYAFLILYSKNTLIFGDKEISTLIYLQIAGNLAGGFLWGYTSQFMGNKLVVVLSQVVSLMIPILAITCFFIEGSVIAFWVMCIAIFLAGINFTSWLGYTNYIIDIAHKGERANLIVLTSLVVFPFTFTGYLAGISADIWGFLPMFVIGIIVSIAGLILSIRLKSRREIADFQRRSLNEKARST